MGEDEHWKDELDLCKITYPRHVLDSDFALRLPERKGRGKREGNGIGGGAGMREKTVYIYK